MKKISREIAARLGLKRFFTGVPCRNGHNCERLVNGKECVECHRLRQQRQRDRDPELARLRNRLTKQKQKARDPEGVRQQWREWYARQKAKKQEISPAADSGNEKTARGFSESA
jgi:hypothetical protein